MNCLNCQTENLPEAKFCVECGRKLTTASSTSQTISLWIKRILILLLLFQAFLTFWPLLGYFLCQIGNQTICQGLRESYLQDMGTKFSFEQAIFRGFIYEGLWLVITIIIFWAFVKRKRWFLNRASIYAIVFLIRSFRYSIFFIDIILGIVLLILVEKNKGLIKNKKPFLDK